MKIRFKSVLLVVAVILLAESILTGLIPHARGYLFGFLETKEGPIYLALGIYFLNYLSLDFFQAIKRFFIVKLAMLYRTDRSKTAVAHVRRDKSSGPQRIQEDIKLSYVSRITVWAEYFISGTIVLQLILINLDQPILSSAALLYAAVSVAIAIRFNPRLTHVEKQVQEAEARYRTDLVSNDRLLLLPGANRATMVAEKVHMEYLLFTKLQLGFMSVLPYLVMIPGLVAGEISLGELMKHQASFSLIVVNAAILIQYYTLWVRGQASEERVQDLENR